MSRTRTFRCGRGIVLNAVLDIDNTAGECQGAPAGALYIDASGYPVIDGDSAALRPVTISGRSGTSSATICWIFAYA